MNPQKMLDTIDKINTLYSQMYDLAYDISNLLIEMKDDSDVYSDLQRDLISRYSQHTNVERMIMNQKELVADTFDALKKSLGSTRSYSVRRVGHGRKSIYRQYRRDASW